MSRKVCEHSISQKAVTSRATMPYHSGRSCTLSDNIIAANCKLANTRCHFLRIHGVLNCLRVQQQGHNCRNIILVDEKQQQQQKEARNYPEIGNKEKKNIDRSSHDHSDTTQISTHVAFLQRQQRKHPHVQHVPQWKQVGPILYPNLLLPSSRQHPILLLILSQWGDRKGTRKEGRGKGEVKGSHLTAILATPGWFAVTSRSMRLTQALYKIAATVSTIH